jgi:hypothetical protein
VGQPLTPPLSGVDLHSQSLLSILLFGEKQVDPSASSWMNVRGQMIQSLFKANLAEKAGAQSIDGELKTKSDWAGILRATMAYSAIDEGTRVFGDTGIRALYNDAVELGKVTNVTTNSNVFKLFSPLIMDASVQFAGQLAINKVLSATNATTVQGVFACSAANDNLNTRIFYNSLLRCA